MIAYFSQKLTAAQRKYTTIERECLAVLLSVEKFRPYVDWEHLMVITDHGSLLWLRNLRDVDDKMECVIFNEEIRGGLWYAQ